MIFNHFGKRADICDMIVSMEKVLKLYKKEGETPLECMNRFREQNSEYKNLPMTYAGRLDPLACGELLVLAGEKVHEKEGYCECDKEYYVEALLGYQTDTYDVLGLVAINKEGAQTSEMLTAGSLHSQGRRDFFEEKLKLFIGGQKQLYPPYSSRTVEGKPLWQWAREGKLDEIEIPTREVEIYEISEIQIKEITHNDILARIDEITGLVQGDFRQEEIRDTWHDLSRSRVRPGKTEHMISFRVKCSSGTYIRTLVHNLGQELGTGACIYRLERTKIVTE